MSFGFRHGLPMEADIVWDVRFLPNPHFIEDLQALSGLDKPVQEYVYGQESTHYFLNHMIPLLEMTLPFYEAEGKSYLTIAIGCTGGHHRSVALAEYIANHLKTLGRSSRIRHRDIKEAYL